MARYDYYRDSSGAGYLLEVQSELLDGLTTTVVVPLMQRTQTPPPFKRLNPTFQIDEHAYLMATHLIAAVPRSMLQDPVGSLAAEFDTITNALDMLFQGY